MPGLRWYDLIPLAILALLLFAPKRLPEMGAAIGKSIKAFTKSIREGATKPPADATLPPAPPTPTTEAPTPGVRTSEAEDRR